MKTDRSASLAIALGVAILSSCALLTPANLETRKEMLADIPVQVPAGKPHPATLLVLEPQTRTVYDTTQMAYETRPYEIAYFSRTEWAERPSRMVQPLLVQTLQRAHCCNAVVTPPFMGHYTHTLRTEIVSLQQDFTSDPPALQLMLRVQLTAEASNEVLGTREISVRAPMQERTPHAGAVAANNAMANALKELAEFVRAKMT